jgi:hypothetical protein
MPFKPSVTERRWPAQVFTILGSNSTTGVITVASTRFLRSNQLVKVSKAGQETLTLKVRSVLDDTTLLLGPQDNPYRSVEVVPAAYAGGTLQVDEQLRGSIQAEIITRATYEEEPACAVRNILVDWLGRHHDETNPLPVAPSSSVVKVPYDEIAMDYDPVTQDMTQARYLMGGSVVQTVSMTYDQYSNLTGVTIT